MTNEPDKLAAVIVGQCPNCQHPPHIGPCACIHFYARPGGALGNQQCMCGHAPITSTITMTPCPNCERLAKERDHFQQNWQTVVREKHELMAQRDELRRDRAIEKFSDVKLRSIEAMIGTLDHSLACDDEDWRDQICSSVAQLVEQTNELRRDRERLDWLETELDRENEAMSNNEVMPDSLFRTNRPITREAIDAAMARAQGAEEKPQNEKTADPLRPAAGNTRK